MKYHITFYKMAFSIIIFTVAAIFVQASFQCPNYNQQKPGTVFSSPLINSNQYPQIVNQAASYEVINQVIPQQTTQTVISQPSVQYGPQQIVNQPGSCSNQVLSQPIRSQTCSNQVISQPIINQPYSNQGISSQVISQPCNQGPVISQPCSNQILSQSYNSQPQQYLSSPVINQASSAPVIPTTIAATPCVATTIIDNSVSNSLANALQLLIVSDLIESTLNNRDCGSRSFIESPIIDTIEYQEYLPFQQYAQVVEVQQPIVETYSEYYSTPVVETYGYQDYGFQQQVSPCAAEVVFPASIPAQLTCNLGYMPTTVPVVNVAVEPMPGGFSGSYGCSSCGGNNGYYY